MCSSPVGSPLVAGVEGCQVHHALGVFLIPLGAGQLDASYVGFALGLHRPRSDVPAAPDGVGVSQHPLSFFHVADQVLHHPSARPTPQGRERGAEVRQRHLRPHRLELLQSRPRPRHAVCSLTQARLRGLVHMLAHLRALRFETLRDALQISLLQAGFLLSMV